MPPTITPEQWGTILGGLFTILVAVVRGKSERSADSTQPAGPNFAADWADSLERIFALEKKLEQSMSREAVLLERVEVLETQLAKQPELERQIRELTASGERESSEKALMVIANTKLAADLEKTAAERDFYRAQTAVLKAIVTESIDPNHAILRNAT